MGSGQSTLRGGQVPGPSRGVTPTSLTLLILPLMSQVARLNDALQPAKASQKIFAKISA